MRTAPTIAIPVLLLLLASARAAEPYAPPRDQLLAAAASMTAASRVVLARKQELGVWPGEAIDPNRTGMVGQEYTGMTTTAGTLRYKRTPTSPDFAAGMVRYLAAAGLARDERVLLVMSGSFVGADLSTLIALEAIGARITLIPTLGSSQWGANDPELTIVDILDLLHGQGVVATVPLAGAIGGNEAVGSNMDPAVLPTLRAAFATSDVPLVEAPALAAIVDDLADRIAAAAGGRDVFQWIIKVGGSAVGLGANPDDCDIDTGFQDRPPLCEGGVPGLLHLMGSDSVRVLNMVDMQKLAAELHVDVDPVPLPTSGENRQVYGEP